MKRMEETQRNRLRPWTKDANEFNANLDGMLHEAEIMAVLAQAMLDQSYVDSYDFVVEKDYIKWATTVRDNMVRTVQAVKEKDFDTATDLVRDNNTKCSECHGAYRN